MTVRGLLLASALFASAPADAASCHRYARWYYPWPQRCGFVALARQAQIRANSRKFLQTVSLGRGPSGPDIPLPSLARADFDGGEADEATRAYALLRAALEAANAH
jgi:hypothetical protein